MVNGGTCSPQCPGERDKEKPQDCRSRKVRTGLYLVVLYPALMSTFVSHDAAIVLFTLWFFWDSVQL